MRDERDQIIATLQAEKLEAVRRLQFLWTQTYQNISSEWTRNHVAQMLNRLGHPVTYDIWNTRKSD